MVIRTCYGADMTHFSDHLVLVGIVANVKSGLTRRTGSFPPTKNMSMYNIIKLLAAVCIRHQGRDMATQPEKIVTVASRQLRCIDSLTANVGDKQTKNTKQRHAFGKPQVRNETSFWSVHRRF
jgi:hypothetical protein